MDLHSGKPLNFKLTNYTSVTVTISFGKGSIYDGFEYITGQVWWSDSSLPQQFIGSLPANIELAETLKQWQTVYLALAERLQMGNRSIDDDDDFEIEEDAVTNVSLVSFTEVSQSLQTQLNQWLLTPDFVRLEKSLREQITSASKAYLDSANPIPTRIILQTEDNNLQRLPWQSWQLLTDYPLAEIALSQPQFQRNYSAAKSQEHKQVRILAILGSTQGIDLEHESYLLQQIPDAQVQFLTQPSRQELDEALWDSQGWDILFFAGHSQTEKKTGRLYLQDAPSHSSVTVNELKEALTTAIDQGLQLAIFNSCDGLGLANSLAELQIPTTIVMREPVPNRVAQQFFQNFLQGYSQEQLPLYLAVKQARRQLQRLEDDYPGASLLPIICQNPAIFPSSWLQLGGFPPCPYRGLKAFQESDADIYFGHENLSTDLAKKLANSPLIPILGASGSGKSSFVFASLIPQLRQDKRYYWLIESFRPQSNPLQSLATAIQAWDGELEVNQLETEFSQNWESLKYYLEKIQSRSSANSRLVLVIDQFEEVYTLSNPETRQAFLQLLVNAIEEVPKFAVVLTMRADFLAQVLEFEAWAKLWQRYEPEFLLPLSAQELEQAIAIPAARAGVQFESGLVSQILDSVQGKVGYLPLLQFALTQLWSLQEKGILTHEAYQKLGGVYSALVDYAEDVYARLSAEQRLKTQQLFLQLVQVNSNSEVTRRIVNKVQIKDWDLALHLTSERLLTTNRNISEDIETIEIVHEALIHHWRRLKDWILSNQDFLRWQNSLNTALEEWVNHDCSEGYLLRHAPLVEAQLWLDKNPDYLTAEQKFFIDLSINLRDREEKAEKQRQEKELQQERKIRRSAQKLAFISFFALSLVTVAGIWTWWERQRSVRIIETVSVASRATTPDLLRDLPLFLNLAQRRQQSGEEDIALAYYQKILTEITKLERQAQKQTDEFTPQSLMELKSMQSEAEQAMVEILQAKLIPSLETSLQNQQIGSLLPQSNLLDYEDQYTEGALQTTYILLVTPQGAYADVNQDGEINDMKEAKRLPCELLEQIERLWREYTNKNCGFYGDNSFYQANSCHSLHGRTLTEQTLFGSYEAIGDRLKQCNIAPANASVYQ